MKQSLEWPEGWRDCTRPYINRIVSVWTGYVFESDVTTRQRRPVPLNSEDAHSESWLRPHRRSTDQSGEVTLEVRGLRL